jgi:hypothetical protein
METFWDEANTIATERFFIIDAASGEVTRYAASTQAYNQGQITSILREAGYGEIAFFPTLTGQPANEGDEFFVVSASRPVSGQTL